MSYLKQLAGKITGQTPQSQPLPGSSQAPNSAGGYAWAVDDWIRLDRFLVLGSEGGSYYSTQQALTAENSSAVLRCIDADGARAVARIAEVSEQGRAPKNDPALFALALAAAAGDQATRVAALAALPRVARTGTHLFHFAAFADGMRGWGRGLRNALAAWYSMPAERLALQAVKYQQRDGWSHRDLLRLAHPLAPTEQHQALFHWITKGWEWVGDDPHPDQALQLVWAFEKAKRATTVEDIVRLVRAYRLPREAVPAQFLADPAVWEALLVDMPVMALIRNLATLTRVGVLDEGKDAVKLVVERLGDQERLRRARIHPISVLAAQRTYAQGHGVRSSNTWTPLARVIDALDGAFYACFGNVTPTGKRTVLALDVSGSMAGGSVAGVPGLTPRDASAAMALVTAATETDYRIMAFGQTFLPLQISPRQRLTDAITTVSGLPFQGTDCALPMLWALEKGVKADAFVIYTDNETWYGQTHPAEALRRYRAETGIAAKLIVVAMIANMYSIADPNDAGMLDIVGFDTAAPNLISDFVRGTPADTAAEDDN